MPLQGAAPTHRLTTSLTFRTGPGPGRTLSLLGPFSRFPLASLQSALASASQSLRQHPRAVAAAVLALVAGTGVTAFGIAPLAPDAAELPRRQIVEDVTPEAIAPQLEALAGAPLVLHRTELTRPADTAANPPGTEWYVLWNDTAGRSRKSEPRPGPAPPTRAARPTRRAAPQE